MGSVLFGYDLGVIAGVVGSTSYAELFKANAAQKCVDPIYSFPEFLNRH